MINDNESWNKRQKDLESLHQTLDAGFKAAAPRYAAPEAPMEQSVYRTTVATLQEGLTASIFSGFQFDKNAKANPDYDVKKDMRPQDYPYVAQFALSPNTEETNRLQSYIDSRNYNYQAMQARPWVSGFSSFLDPLSLTVDVATYGIGHFVSIPLLANTIRRTQKGIELLNIGKNVPRVALGTEEAIKGAQAGATSIYTQEKIKESTDLAYINENLGEHIFMGTLIGAALGGSVGLLGKPKVNNLTDRFTKAADIGQEHNYPPPPPPKPKQEEVFGKGLRAELKEEAPKRTPEQIETDSLALIFETGKGGQAQRGKLYEALRRQFTIIGEKTNLPEPIKKAFSLLLAPVKNLSSTNRSLYAPFGTSRLAAISFARNAIEFLGTREGFVLPRSAQNRIEDITNHALDLSLDAYKLYLKANGIEKGAFASERMLLGERILNEKEFFEGISDTILHIGKPTAKEVNPYIQQAADKIYNEFYKPYGELLKEFGLINKNADMDKVVNYLNRQWSTDKILSNPEEFKNWMADYFREINKMLKSIMPNYNAAINDARNLSILSRRFEKAADKIDKLKSQIEADNKYASKIFEINKNKEEFLENIQNKYDDLRDKVLTKENIDNSAAAKKSLNAQIKKSISTLKSLTKEYEATKKDLKSQIKEQRQKLAQKKKEIKNGEKDDYIRSETKKRDLEILMENPEFKSYSLEELEAVSTEAVESLDEQSLKRLRNDLISEERFYALESISELKMKLSLLQKEKDEILEIAQKDLNNNINEAKKLAKSDAGAKQLNIKILDLKEASEIALYEKDHINKIQKINSPVIELENLQRIYSREGFKLYATRRGIEKQAKQLEKFGANPDITKKMINQARREEKKGLNEAPIVDEARILSEELKEDSVETFLRAEEMIPEELRSTSTGRPYRIFDEDIEPGYAYNRAEKTFYTMLGQEDEIVVNPILQAFGGGQSSVFKPRSIKMLDNYPGIENWVERDIRFLLNNFANGISPVIALTELMQELNKLPLIQQTVKRMQVLNKTIGPKKALDMPSEMTHYTEIPKVFASMLREEFRLMSEGISGEALEKLLRKYNKAEKDLSTMYQQTMGVFGNGVNLNSKTASEFVDLFNSAASTVTTNNIVISMMTDLMAPSVRYGFSKYIEKSLLPLLRSPQLRAMTERELKHMHVALKVAQGEVIKSRISNKASSLRNSGLGKFITNLANRIGNITGANSMQNMMEIASVVLIKGEFLDSIERVALGTASKKELTHLAQRSISPEQAKAIYDLWKRFGHTMEGIKGIDPALLENALPSELQAFSKYMALVNDELRTTIVRPGQGSTPDFGYSWGGNAVLYLKRYFFAATNDFIIPGLQRGDKEAIQGFSGLFAIGALQSKIRALYRNEEEKEFNIEGFIVEALTNSALPGIYTFGLDAGLTAGIISGMGGARYDPSNGLPSLILGPGVVGLSDRTLSILGKMRKIMTDEDKQFTYKDVNYLASTAIPLYKWWPVSSVVKPNLKQYMESQGRGE